MHVTKYLYRYKDKICNEIRVYLLALEQEQTDE